ncbi:MAG: sugar nucleotide-binding protein [Sphingobium sp.]|jgi:dTDP-4-dehydrorhamnose reductase|nr:sugar nucleotide-binding protein [Sphingobium sp.]MCI1271590.1 sugar nucleotide-binding protein [Sphingobium sp.]MCI2053670.1 sugar nucleotide-binding protein [Sphingobium sp.]
MHELELWGGPECTVNRVGDQYRDQLAASGHEERLSDIDLMADLGFATLRYPVLWERVAPHDPARNDWSWTDRQLEHIRSRGMRVIAGLVHHGSGPAYANILSDAFAPGLARHARNVAERYPWIDAWTPVNEPVTTARFCALYGFWHPHARDERLFWTALLNQIDGVRLAMREVREVNPGARLVQTDDLGRTYATAALREQAAFDNARRWMGWDLLCGRVVPGHDLWQRLCDFGFEARLRAMAEAPCPPDIIGINHYLTSDRFLDHRLQRYPARNHGSNKRQRFADTEAVRVLAPPPPGLRGVAQEAWERYGLPLAITEVHNGCTRDEQMRWTWEAWNVARALRDEGVDLRAVTSWSLLGSHGWNTLLTGEGRYEPGTFDVSGPAPRATAMTALLRGLAGGANSSHPVLAGAGWWRRPIRLAHPPAPRPAPMREHVATPSWSGARTPPLLILGATGTLGQAIAAACRHRDIAHVLTSRGQLDLGNGESIAAALDFHKPWCVVNAAGWVRVDDAEKEADACHAANAAGALRLAEACARRGIPTVSFSSDLVFDGQANRPYRESDAAAPLNVYGRSKRDAEQAVLALSGSHLIVRTAAFFSAADPHNFAIHALQALASGQSFRAAQDHVVSPTFVPQLVNAVLDLCIDGAEGLWHLTNGEPVSWADFGRRVAAACGMRTAGIEAVPGASLGWVAPRPLYVPLASEKGRLMGQLDEAMDHFAYLLREKRPDLARALMAVQ